MPIRSRLTVLFTIGAAALMAVVGTLYVITLRSGLVGNLDATLRTRAADVITQLRGNVTTGAVTETTSGIVVQLFAASSGAVVDGSDLLGRQRLLSVTQAKAAARAPIAVDRTVILGSGSGSSQESGTDNLRVVAVSGPAGLVVTAAISRDAIDGAVASAARELLVVAVLLVVAAAGGAWLLGRAALRPVDSMRRQAAELTVSAAGQGIAVPKGRDEIARLGATFNELLNRLKQAMDRERAFVDDAGHELRTPLTVLKGELELALRPGRSAADMRAMITTASEETDRIVRLAEDLLVLARTSETQAMQQGNITELVRDAVVALNPLAAAAGVGIDVAPGRSVVARAEPGSLRRAVDNVITNALRFAPRDTRIDVDVVVADERCVITVRDRGPGFPLEFLPRAFERFSHADAARHRPAGTHGRSGTGLGLAIVATILRAHGGEASADNHPDGGAVVTLSWPIDE